MDTLTARRAALWKETSTCVIECKDCTKTKMIFYNFLLQPCNQLLSDYECYIVDKLTALVYDVTINDTEG